MTMDDNVVDLQTAAASVVGVVSVVVGRARPAVAKHLPSCSLTRNPYGGGTRGTRALDSSLRDDSSIKLPADADRHTTGRHTAAAAHTSNWAPVAQTQDTASDKEGPGGTRKFRNGSEPENQGSAPHGGKLVVDWWSTEDGNIEHGGLGGSLMGGLGGRLPERLVNPSTTEQGLCRG